MPRLPFRSRSLEQLPFTFRPLLHSPFPFSFSFFFFFFFSLFLMSRSTTLFAVFKGHVGARREDLTVAEMEFH